MIICICNDINDQEIRSAVRQGKASCVDTIRDVTGAGDCCGTCSCKVESIIQQEQALTAGQQAAAQVKNIAL